MKNYFVTNFSCFFFGFISLNFIAFSSPSSVDFVMGSEPVEKRISKEKQKSVSSQHSKIFAATSLPSSTDFVMGSEPVEEIQKSVPSRCSGIFIAKDREGRDVGYHCGYSTIEGMVFLSSSKSFFSFIDLRGHWLHNNRLLSKLIALTPNYKFLQSS